TAVAVLQRDGTDHVAIDIGGDWAERLEHAELPAAAPGRQHGLDDGDADARLGAEAADPARAGIEVAPGAALGCQGVMVAVILADAIAQLAIGAGDAELLDPAMLVGRYGLAGELPAQPVIFLGEND